ncbi:hypothetical protein D9757_014012 [Collybiopsis confluens]|nr:hypothetical protein D9757_014012 [Collybiopsis confluens]
MSDSEKKLILVIGATGLQGMPFIKNVLAPLENGDPAPYAVRALTRDAKSEKAQMIASLGGEVIQGDVTDQECIATALEGCYAVFMNVDTNSVGEQAEIYAAIKTFESSHRVPQMRHFIWSSLEYYSKYGKYDKQYRAVNYDSKGIVNDWIRAQPHDPSGEGLSWTIINTGSYYDNLAGALMGPLPEKDEDGNIVFALPCEDGHIPAISLEDIAWWARYCLDNRDKTSGEELWVAGENMTIDELTGIFQRATGLPAVRKRISVEEYLDHHPKLTAANREKLAGMFASWRDDLVGRDMEWLYKTHPKTDRLEDWIRKKGYSGILASSTDAKRYRTHWR